MEIPKWFDDPTAPRPSPCGKPSEGQMVLFQNKEGATMLIHLSCAQQGGLLGEDDDGPER